MSEDKATVTSHSRADFSGERRLNESHRISSLLFPVTIETAIKAILFSPVMLISLALGAVSTFLSVSYIGGVVSSGAGSVLPFYYSTYGAVGLTPPFLLMEWLHMYLFILMPMLLFASLPLGYGISNIVAEDIGAMPENLLLSRPVSRWRYVLYNFLLRSVITITLTFLIPFLLAYPSVVSALENSPSWTYVARKVPLDQWRQLAWGAPLVEVLLLFSSALLVFSAIALTGVTISRRGAIAVPAVLILAGAIPVIGAVLFFVADYGGVIRQGLPLVLHLLSPFRVFTGEVEASYSFTNLLIGSTAWWVFLLAFSLASYNRTKTKS